MLLDLNYLFHLVLHSFSRFPFLTENQNYLSNGNAFTVARHNLDLNALAETLELLADVTCSLHGAVLDEVLEAPLRTVTCVHPLGGRGLK